MKMLRISRNYHNLTRLIKIVSVLGKYGFSIFLKRISAGLGVLPAKILAVRQEKSVIHLTEPERVRLAIEELGPAFIKLGQLLSLRPDIIPPEYAAELEKLQDKAPPVPFKNIREAVESELGLSLGEVFSSFEEEPFASGSIAQVHRAVLRESGERVAVKVLKPKTRSIVEADLAILTVFAKLTAHYVPEFKALDPMSIMHEFSELLLNQLNFLREARTIDRFRAFFKGDGSIRIPKVYREHTTAGVLVMEFIDGIKITDVEALDSHGMDRKLIAELGARLILREIFEFGFFHADPHPGNIFVLPGNVIALVDFGITGYIDEQGIRIIGDVLLGLLDRDVERIIRTFKRYDFIKEDVDQRRLKVDLYDLIDVAGDIPLSKIDVPSSIQTVFEITRKYRVRFPGEYFIIFNALLEADGVGRKLHPEFNITEFARPHARRWMLRQYSPKRYRKELGYLVSDLAYFFKALPSELGEILKRVRVGNLKLPIYHENLDRAVSELDRIGNRLSFAIIIASLLLSSSIILQAKIGPFVRGYPILGLAGFAGAVIMGLWLLVGIIRSGRL